MRAYLSRRMLLGGAVGVAGVAALAACGQVPVAPTGDTPADGKTETKTVAPPAGKEAVTLWVEWPLYSEAKEIWYHRWADAYVAQNPHITIEPLHNTNPDEKITATLAAGAPIDVAWHGWGWARFAAEGIFMPLEDLAKSANWDLGMYYQAALDGLSWQGRLHALPLGMLTAVVAINLDAFAKAGVERPSLDWTFDDFIEIGTKLTDAPNGKWAADLRSWYWSTWYVAYGGDQGSVNNEWQQMSYDTPLRAQMVHLRNDFLYVHKIEPFGDDVAEATLFDNFVNEKVAIYGGYNWLVPSFRKNAQFEWDLHPIPFVDFQGEKSRHSALYTEEIAIVSGTSQLDEAWNLSSWLCGPEQLEDAARHGDTTPTIKTLAEGPAFINPDLPPGNNIALYLTAMETALPFLVHPKAQELAAPLGKYTGDATLPNATITPEEALSTANQEAQVVLDDFNNS